MLLVAALGKSYSETEKNVENWTKDEKIENKTNFWWKFEEIFFRYDIAI